MCRDPELPRAWRCSKCGDTEPGADMPMRDCTGPLDAEGNCGYWEPVTEPKLGPCAILGCYVEGPHSHGSTSHSTGGVTHSDSESDFPTCPRCGQEIKTEHSYNGNGHWPDCPESPLQPCGHPMSAIASSDEGTSYCCDCEANGGTPHPHVPAEANISGECDCETVALVVTERDALKAALREARDFVIAIDYASVNRFEPRRVEMVQSIDAILGETPK